MKPAVRSRRSVVAPARASAFDVLLRVERDQAYASELLHSAAYEQLSTVDRGLATELIMGVLRWRSRLDTEIAAASSKALSKLDLEVLIALRLALYQFRWLDRVPHRAALHESVELVKRARKHSASSFVNAVLRALSGSRIKRPLPLAELSNPEEIACGYAHPLWMVDRWAREYGLSVARRICEYDQSIPATSLRARISIPESDLVPVDKNTDGKQRCGDIESDRQKIILAPGQLLASARRVEAGDITKTEAFRNASVVIQDEGSQLVAALLSPHGHTKPRRFLDCCAAPGGKTLAIADRNSAASITAVEVYPHRARLMRKLLRAAGSNARVQVVVADVTNLPVSIPFDAVLADVPCSGTGTLARNPEIKWRLNYGDLADLQARQIAIARAALAQVASGGRLVYSTCSLEREENEDVIEQLLDGSIRLIDCRLELDQLRAAGELLWAEPATLLRGPYLRTIPGVHPCDGFFAAILQRV